MPRTGSAPVRAMICKRRNDVSWRESDNVIAPPRFGKSISVSLNLVVLFPLPHKWSRIHKRGCQQFLTGRRVSSIPVQ